MSMIKSMPKPTHIPDADIKKLHDTFLEQTTANIISANTPTVYMYITAKLNVQKMVYHFDQTQVAGGINTFGLLIPRVTS